MNGLTLRINGGGRGKCKSSACSVAAVNFPKEFADNFGAKNEPYKQFFASTTADDQLSKLKVILSHDRDDLDKVFLEFLVMVFLETPAKHPVKCFLTRHITKTKSLQSLFRSALSAAILTLTSNTSNFVTCSEVTNKLPTLAESTEGTDKLPTEVTGNFPTFSESTEVNSKLSTLAESTGVTEKLPTLAESTEVTGNFPTFAEFTEVNSKLPTLAESTEVTGNFPTFAEFTEVNSKLPTLAESTEGTDKLPTQVTGNFPTFAEFTEVNSKLPTHAESTEVTGKLPTLAKYTEVTTKLATCIENFPTGSEAVRDVEIEVAEFMKEGLLWCVDALSKSTTLAPTEKNEIFNLCHSALRILLYIVQKVSKDNSAKLNFKFAAVRASVKYLLFDEDVPMDTKSVCGILLLSTWLVEKGEGAWKDLLQPGKQTDEMRQILTSEAGQLALYSAIVIIVPADRIQREEVDGSPAYVVLTNNILGIGERCSSEATFTLGVTRTILQIAKCLPNIRPTALGQAIVDSMLVFIWSHLEHYMDSVRHLTAQAMGCVVKYCSRMRDEGSPEALDSLFAALTCLDKGRKSYYVSVTALTNELGPRDMLGRLPALLGDMLDALPLQAVQACVTLSLEAMLPRSGEDPGATYTEWVLPLLTRVAKRELDSCVLAVFEDLLSKIVKRDPAVVELILPHIAQGESGASRGELKCALLLASVGRKSGALPASPSVEQWRGIVHYEVLKAAAVDSADETRILSLSLVVESQKATEPFSRGDLDFILYYLKYNINTQSPNFRQLTLSFIKKFMKRFDDSYKVLKRQREPKVFTDKDDYYLDFLEKLREQCFYSLLSGSNYSRRFVALQTLVWCENLNLEGYSRIWKDEYVEKLLLHLEDSYENNKAYALEILEKCPVELLQGKKYSISLEIEDILRQASSVKPTDCASAAYKLKLLKRKLAHIVLEGKESVQPEAASYSIARRLVLLLRRQAAAAAAAAGSALLAAARAPVYGLLHCLACLLNDCDAEAISCSEQWRTLIANVIQVSLQAAAAAAPIVNSDSPEGRLPPDVCRPSATLSSDPEEAQVTAQMVLLCAWRTVKEVSLLLGELSNRLTVEGEGPSPGTLTHGQLLSIGQHLTQLLAETKHRGAFEQAYVGFTLLLTRLWRCRSSALYRLPSVWLQSLLSLVESGHGSLCATRRGAGVPFMIQALVTTELQVSGNPRCLQLAMRALLRLAGGGGGGGGGGDTRTHALNILRALYRNTTLGDSAAPYVSEGVQIAVNGFDAPTWPERNSSTLLFSALCVRIFGVRRARAALCARNKMTGRIFFLRYPALYDFMLNKLREANSSSDPWRVQPATYPVLLLLARLYPSALEGTVSNLKLSAFSPLVQQSLSSSTLQTRRLSARAAVPLVPPARFVPLLQQLMLIVADRGCGANYCHGVLLQLIKLLEAKPEGIQLDQEWTSIISESLEAITWLLEQALGEKACFLLADEYVKVVNLILWKYPALLSERNKRQVESVLQKLLFCEHKHLIASGKEIFLSNALYLHLVICYEKQPEDVAQLIVKGLLHNTYEVVLSALNYLLILYDKCDKETFCKFQEHLEDITDKERVLHALRNEDRYLKNLTHVLGTSKYLECVRKCLKILSLEKGTQRMIIGVNEESSKEEVVEKLMKLTETEHDNVTHIYLDSLLKFVSDELGDLLKENLMDIARTVFGNSSSENSEDVREVVVEFVERNYRELLDKASEGFSEEESFEYKSTIWSTIVTLLEDDSDILRQRISNIVSELSRNDTNGPNVKVIPSKAAELLRDLIDGYFEDVKERVAMFMVLALLDFKSEVCLTDDGNDEARVFDQNERYNIFLEENMWTNECALKILAICPDDNLLEYLKDIINTAKYRKVIVKLCNNNFKIFEELLDDKGNNSRTNDDALNPKIDLFISKLH